MSSAVNADLVASLGADRVLDYSAGDFTTEDVNYDVVMDCVGNLPFERAAASINPGGALLLVVADLKGILLAPWRSRASGKLITAGSVNYTAEDLAFLVHLAELGQYQAVRDRTYDLADVDEAHRFVDACVRVATSSCGCQPAQLRESLNSTCYCPTPPTSP